MAAAKQAVAQAEQVAANAVPGPQIKHIVRGINSFSNPAEGIYTAEEVEMYIASMQGWKLHSVFYVGRKKSDTAASETHEFAYILEAE